MNHAHAIWLGVALTACSSHVAVTSGSTSGSGGAGGSATSASSGVVGTGGAGGSSLVGASSTSTTSSSSSGAGGALGCGGTYVDVNGDGPAQHYTSLCPWSLVEGSPTGPVAYIPMGGGIISQLQIEGCASSGSTTAGLSLLISNVNVPGTDTKATAHYTDTVGLMWASAGAGTVAVSVDVYEDVGGVVTGSYTAAVESQAATTMLSGTFRACHEWEIPKP